MAKQRQRNMPDRVFPYHSSMVGLIILIGVAAAILAALLTAMLMREMRRPPRNTMAYAMARGWASDPSEWPTPLPFNEWWLERPDGAQLPVWDISVAEPGDSDQRCVVFIHGWGHSRINSLQRVEPFLPLARRMVLYDLRGHGESRNCLSNLGDGEAEDLLVLLDRLDEDRMVLVGHSMGAVIALKAAAAAPPDLAQRITGVLAYGPYCEFHRSLQGRLRVAGYPTRPITDFALWMLRCLGITPLSLREADVAALHCPAMIIHGCDDQVSPQAHAQRLAAATGARFVEIRGAAHVDAHLVDPQQHDTIVHEFFQQLRSNNPASASIHDPVRAEGSSPMRG